MASTSATWKHQPVARAWRNGISARKLPTHAQLNFLAGDWHCPSCGDHQFARNWTCRQCGATRQTDAFVASKKAWVEASDDCASPIPSTGKTTWAAASKKTWLEASDYVARATPSTCKTTWGVNRKTWQQKQWSRPASEETLSTTGEAEKQEPLDSDAVSCPQVSSSEERQASELELFTPPGLEAAPSLEPPPGLAPPDSVLTEQSFVGSSFFCGGPMTDAADVAPQGYQVLLRNYPETMVHAFMLRQILEYAMLDEYLVGVTTRPGGKVLLAFSKLECVHTCIQHFDGLDLDQSGIPTTALYVQTVAGQRPQYTSLDAFAPATAHIIDAPAFVPAFLDYEENTVVTCGLSADASVFVPVCGNSEVQSKLLSPDASVFVPTYGNYGVESEILRSDASTGSYSDNASEGDSSEAEHSR